MKTLIIVVAVVYLVLYVLFAARSGQFKKSIVRTALAGVGILILLHLVGGYFGFMIPLNIYTVTFSALTGLPGVILISVMDLIMNLL